MWKTSLRIAGWIGVLVLSAPVAYGGAGHIDTDGTMDFEFNFRFPPTAQQILDAKDAIRRANDVICDATDGQIRFQNVRLSSGATDEDKADIWFLANPGRSGVSFAFNGSNLGTLGAHINLFSGALTGDIIGHELGHHAFGLGDEYDEQCRFGGPCGIGPCFDSGVNEQNNCIMQQSGSVRCLMGGGGCLRDSDCAPGDLCRAVLMSELCAASNHDLRVGDGVTCGMPACAGGMACTSATCATDWNSTTNRFEVSQQTMAHALLSCWQTLKQNYSFVTVPSGLPAAALPSVCSTSINFTEDVVGTDQVMLFIDRSGSMSTPVAPMAMQTRLDFAKAAARVFVDLQAGRGATVGLISFNQTPTLDRPFADLGFADAAPFKATVDGLVVGGNTGIGDALTASLFSFQAIAATGRTRTAFLLSDGENTSGSDPATGAQGLKNIGVRIFTVPVGDTADRSTLSNIAGTTAGTMLDAPGGDELPAIYAELAARFRGEGLALPRTESDVAGMIIITSTPPPRGHAARSRRGRRRHGAGTPPVVAAATLPEQEDFPFQVEGGGERLNVFLSARNLDVNSWDPGFRLVGPMGEMIDDTDTTHVLRDRFYRIIRIIGPSAGTWKLQVFAKSAAEQRSFVLAHVENPLPDCFVDARPRFVQGGQTVRIGASAAFGATLEGNVSFDGAVRRPDGSIVPLAFTHDALERTDGASFNTFAGRGIYEVTLHCKVGTGARALRGEPIFPGPEFLPPVVPFERTVRTAFFLDVPTLPPCSSTDCDNDGIPNAIEGTDDIDHDGLPCDRDDDCDGDDVPDSVEGTVDTDADGIPDFKDPDSDNDGIPDGLDPHRTMPDPAVCGDGFVETGEGCDDGNTVDGDCCSADCHPEDLGTSTCGVGACERTISHCSAGVPQTCTPGLPGEEGPAGSATCGNGIDDDCDDLTDHADPDCNVPPDCNRATASATEIWPPNHGLVPVSISGVTDADGDPVAITVTGISQDEPLMGSGDGNTCPDASGAGSVTASVRAERAGNRDGRVYHVGFRADDGHGGQCTGSVAVCVPHDQRPGHACGDQGPLFDASGPCN